MACDATTAAQVASTSNGNNSEFGASRKKGLAIAAGLRTSSAPWPK